MRGRAAKHARNSHKVSIDACSVMLQRPQYREGRKRMHSRAIGAASQELSNRRFELEPEMRSSMLDTHGSAPLAYLSMPYVQRTQPRRRRRCGWESRCP